MSRANISDRVEPGVIVRAGNQEWVIGQIKDSVETTKFPIVEKRVSKKIVTLSALEEARNRVVRNTQKYSVRRTEQELAHIPHKTVKHGIHFPEFLRTIPTQIGTRFVSLARRMTGHSTFGDSFKSGLIFGLALGCMSLLLFHQVDSQRGTSGLQRSVEASASGILTRGVAVPGIHVYGLSLGTYPNSREAEKAARIFGVKGVPGAIVHLGKFVLINRIAVQADDLDAFAGSLKKKNVPAQVVPIDVPAQKFPALPSASETELSQTSKWLSSEVSALVTMASWAADGGRQVDAVHAFQNANALYPGDTIISATGLGVSIGQLAKAVQEGNAALSKGDKGTTMACVMRAYQILLDGQGSSF